jgi:hypothetical protein
MPLAVGSGLDGLVAEVTLHYRQRHPGLDQPAGVRVAQVVHAGLLGQANLPAPDHSGCPYVRVDVGSDGSGIPRRPRPLFVKTHSPDRSSVPRVSAGTSMVRMLRFVLGGPARQPLTGHIAPGPLGSDGALGHVNVAVHGRHRFTEPRTAGHKELDERLQCSPTQECSSPRSSWVRNHHLAGLAQSSKFAIAAAAACPAVPSRCP